ncbi:MAG: FAD:protein FMN transferase [Gemmatimonadetes bacterium]|nr:FAD:protein FMN transferase [Gemmatimonadota bacterium]
MDADRPRGLPRRGALRLLAAGGVAAVLGGGAVAELVRRARLHRVARTRTQMGTLVNVTVVHEDADAARAMVAATFDEIERLERVLSRHRSDTPIARLNRDGWVGPVPPELHRVVRAATRWAHRTGGAFDPTVAPLLNLWAARFATTGAPPDRHEIDRARARVGWRALSVEEDTLAFQRPGMALTLDGIAKGYVVDRAVATLVAAGAGRVMVDAGGDMASAAEGRGSDPWRVSIQHPRDPGGSLGVVDLLAGSVATSGDYMQAFTQDRSAHHIVDPRTGHSPPDTAAVTVLAPTAMDADALSTAALVLGPTAALDLLEGIEAVEAMIVTKDGAVRSTRGFPAKQG